MEDYLTMLNELYLKLGDKKGTGNRFEVPNPEIFYQGSTTIWKNFNKFVDVFRRDREFIIKFFKKELGAPIDDYNEYIKIHSKISLDTIKIKIQSFLDLYVKCYECKGYDTYIINEQKLLVCEICGASRIIKI